MISKIFSANYYNTKPKISIPISQKTKGYLLYWIVKGNTNFTINSKNMIVSGGQIVIISPNQEVTINIQNDSDIIYADTTFLLDDDTFKKLCCRIKILH